MKLNSEGGEAYVSYMGACLTALLYAITGIFLYSKVMVLYKISDVTILSSIGEGAFTPEDKFSASNGMFLAAALTAYDGETEPIEEAKYGKLTIGHYGWGNGGDGTLGSQAAEVENHNCSDYELGLADRDENTQIFPIFESSLNEVTTWKKKFRCVKKEDMVIWGDYNSLKAQ